MKNLKKFKNEHALKDPKRFEKKSQKKRRLNPMESKPPKYRKSYLNNEL